MSCAGPNNPLNVTVVTQSTVARAYITDNTAGNVYVCDINNGGVFSGPCVTATATAIFNNPYGITLNTDGTKAYVAQFGVNGVYTCDIDQTTGLFTTCNLSTTSPISPLGIALNTDDSIGYLAANGNQNIYYCPPNDFSSGTCQSTDYINLVNPAGGPAPIQNVFPNNSISYVIDANAPTMYACNVNINGSFSSCSATGSNLNFPNGIAINPAGTFLYLTNSPNSVTTCDVTTLPSCNGTTTGFDQPYGIAVNGTGTFVYVVNRASKNISVCSIQNNGSLANCKIAGDLSASGLPQSIVISPNLS
jgi:DNA-binding beta-propeller fold protein YncE